MCTHSHVTSPKWRLAGVFGLSLFKVIFDPSTTCYTKLQTGQVELSL